MISADEAYEHLSLLCEEEAEMHLAKIEEEIRDSINKKTFTAWYAANKFKNDLASDAVFHFVHRQLTDKGYVIKYSGSYIEIGFKK